MLRDLPDDNLLPQIKAAVVEVVRDWLPDTWAIVDLEVQFSEDTKGRPRGSDLIVRMTIESSTNSLDLAAHCSTSKARDSKIDRLAHEASQLLFLDWDEELHPPISASEVHERRRWVDGNER